MASDTHAVLTKKQLARELNILTIVQIVALCAVGIGLFLLHSNVVSNLPEWDTIHSLCVVLALCGIVVYIITVFWGSYKLMDVAFLPIWLRIYSGSVWILSLCACLLLIPGSALPILVPIYILLLYWTIPQFFIARWLAKKPKDATIETVQEGKEQHELD